MPLSHQRALLGGCLTTDWARGKFHSFAIARLKLEVFFITELEEAGSKACLAKGCPWKLWKSPLWSTEGPAEESFSLEEPWSFSCLTHIMALVQSLSLCCYGDSVLVFYLFSQNNMGLALLHPSASALCFAKERSILHLAHACSSIMTFDVHRTFKINMSPMNVPVVWASLKDCRDIDSFLFFVHVVWSQAWLSSLFNSGVLCLTSANSVILREMEKIPGYMLSSALFKY